MKGATVTVVQRRLTHYRVPFFLALRDSLSRSGITFRLLHGEGTTAEAEKNDAGRLNWAEPLTTTYLAGGRFCWQPFARQVADSDLVILTHENALLANQLALIRRPAPRLAFWGHGANLQGDARSLREAYKRWTTRQANWYFAYTSQSVELVVEAGFPRSRITRLDNAIDMAELRTDIAASRVISHECLRTKLGLDGGPVGLFLGSLYTHKRISFLLAAAERIRKDIDGFQLLVVGDGPQRPLVEAAAARQPWIRYVGSRRGPDKADALNLASIIMNPGLVGLGILDSFAAGVPMVTTDCGLHSPEIAYLASDNGIITQDNLDSYVTACVRLFSDSNEHSRLVAGCRIAAERYTLANMVGNFTQGVLHALEASQ